MPTDDSLASPADGEQLRVGRIAALVLLYVLQGVPFGLVTGSVPFILRDAGASYRAVGLLSLAVYPYAFKVLLAPLVDAYDAREALGRRRSWVLPLGLAAGAHSIWLGARVDGLLAAAAATTAAAGDGAAGDGAAAELALLLGSLVLLFAVMDVAVDAWALWLLRGPRNQPFASTAQTVGLSLGNGIGFPLLLLLRRVAPGAASAGSVLFWAGVADLAVVGGVALLLRCDDYGPGRDAEGRPEGRRHRPAAAPAAMAAAPRVPMREVAACVLSLLRLPHMRRLALLLLSWPVASVAVDTAVPLAFLALGVPEAQLAAALAAQAPLQVLLSGAVAVRISRGLHPLRAWVGGFRAAVGAAALFPALLLAAHACCAAGSWREAARSAAAGADPGEWDAGARAAISASPLFLAASFGALTLSNYANKAVATSLGGFFNDVADHRVGATYVTLLNTLVNLGRLWPKFFALALMDRAGFFPVAAACAAAGLALLQPLGGIAAELQRVPRADWRAAITAREKKAAVAAAAAAAALAPANKEKGS